jgi:outer membrane receptor for ferrienterochelin and colicins
MKTKILKKLLILTLISTNLFAGEEIFLSIFKKGVFNKLLPVNTKVITESELKNYSVNNIGELLEKIVSIDVGHWGDIGSAKSVRVRNSTSEQVLILLNGVPLNNIAKGSLNLNNIPFDNVERIEIFYGASAAVYGYNSVSATINIITKQQKEQNNFYSDVFVGSFEKNKYLAGIDYNKNNYFLTTNISRMTSKGWRENAKYNSIDGYFNLKKIINNNRSINFNILTHTSESGVPGSAIVPKTLWDGEIEKIASTPFAKQNDTNLYFNSEYSFLKGNIKLGIFQEQLIYDNSRDTFWPSRTDSILNGINFYGSYVLPYETTVSLEVVNNSIEQKYPLSLTDNFNKNITNYAFGIQKIFNKDKLSFIPFLRYDTNSYFGSNASVLAIITYNLEKSKISLSAGNSWRTPTFLDLYWPNDFFSVGNPNLKPEKSYSLDLGYETNFSVVNVNINPFYRVVEEQIRWYSSDPSNWLIPYTPENVDKSISLGSEVSFKIVPMRNFENSISLNIIDTKVYKKGEENLGWQKAAYSPNLFATYNFNLILPYKISLNSDLKYVGIQYSRDNETGEKFDPYTIWNLKVDKKISSNFDLYLTVNDVLDQKGINRENYPVSGRNYEAGLKMNFNI